MHHKEIHKHVSFGKNLFVGINKDKQLITDKYEVKKKLGKGGYGIVYEVQNKQTKDLRACKVLSKKKVSDDFVTEKEILLNADLPNIVKLLDIYEDKRFYYLVMEECLGGELFDKIIDHIQEGKMFSEKDAAKIMKQVFVALAYCHSRGICHRDLKPENLLLATKDENSPIKIIDFGLSKRFTGEEKMKMSRKVGTSYYVAPEVLKGDYNEKCDVWSAGVILYILLSGDPPFNGRDDQAIYAKVREEKFDFPEKKWANISNEAKEFIKKMLCKQDQRLSAQECLNDPWFKICEEKKDMKPLEFDVNHFKDYVHSSKLKKMALTYVADRLNEDKISDLKEKFFQIDKDKNGTISYNELKEILVGSGLSEEEMKKMYTMTDTNKDGVIEYTEFIAAALDIKKDIRDVYLSEAFNSFDTDGSGKISKEELMKILQVEEGDSQTECVKKIIERVDKNGDGEIDYEEFLDLFNE
ncbi:MAG: protein kinase [archaeon]|nr:protein kinase [archaeon]